jgi:hypothetical protein
MPEPQSETAEIEWRAEDAEARFSLVVRGPHCAEGRIVAQSPALAWPPAGPDTMEAMVAAVEALERSATDAGWTSLRAGPAWYAKRFACPPATNETYELPEDRPFARPPHWPPGARDRWRCEIHWDAGWIDSRFRAVVYRPRRRRGRDVAASTPLRWLLMSRPDPHRAEHRDALRGLAAAIEDAGWTPAGEGAGWYSRRFVWPYEDCPPRSFPVALSENTAAVRIGTW